MLCAPLFSQSEAYQKALKNYQGERYLEALVAIQEALDRHKDKASYYHLQAKILSALFQFSDAEKSLRHAIELQPGLAEPHYELGVLLFRDEKFRPAAARRGASLRTGCSLVQGRDFGQQRRHLDKPSNWNLLP